MTGLERLNSILFAGTLLGLNACGSAELNSPESGALTTESNAVEAATDVPAASAIQVFHDRPALWVFACDRDHNLVRVVRPSPNSNFFNSPEQLDIDCASVPAVEPEMLGSVARARVWVRRTSNHLSVYTISEDTPLLHPEDVSNMSGFGSIAGTPVPMGTQLITNANGVIDAYETIAVRSDSNRLYTLVNYQPGQTGENWSWHPVTRLTGSTITTQNTFSTTTLSLYGQALAGRGSYSGDDATGGWVATSTNVFDPEAQFTTTLPISNMTGTPTFGGGPSDDNSGTIVVAPFTFTIMSAPLNTGRFTAMSGCSTSGSPSGSRLIGYVRGNAGDLVMYNLTQNSCQIMNGTGAVKLASAPSIVGDYQGHSFGFENDAFYKGVDGFLHYFDYSTQTHSFIPVLLP